MPADQKQVGGENAVPEAIVQDALRSRSATIAYTYTEPTIFFEFALDTARLAAKKGLRNVFVSNGYMTEACLQEIHPDLHGANVDLKAFTDRYYKELCGAKLAPVLETLESMVKLGIWLEVTTLLVPGQNDTEAELRELAGFLARLDPGIPWHISRFHPTYRLTNIHATPPETIRRARDIGYEAGLKYVYTGNLPGDSGEKTFCHRCGERLIDRYGFSVQAIEITDGRCPKCESLIPGVWQ
jgi:pyruvate formate lyase activating enzyme